MKYFIKKQSRGLNPITRNHNLKHFGIIELNKEISSINLKLILSQKRDYLNQEIFNSIAEVLRDYNYKLIKEE